jgi:Protein of unknown function (DUF2809)
MSPISHRHTTCATLALATILTGLIWRMAPLHLPFFLWKYGGSTLWAIAVYWMIAFLLPSARPITLTTLACLFALAVEFSRLIPSPTLEAFRETLAGRLILGSIFSPRNIVAYWLAILLAALADSFSAPGRRNRIGG